MMKNFFMGVALFVLVLGVSPVAFVHAQSAESDGKGFVALAPIPGLTDSQENVTANTLANFFNNLYKYLIGLAAALAVVMIVWGGLEIATTDSVSKHGAGRERITQAILGLVLVLAPVLVFSIINPSILNLSLNLPALNTKNSGWTGNGGGGAGLTEKQTATGALSVFDGEYMDFVKFTDSEAAKSYACQEKAQVKTLFNCSQTNTQDGKCAEQYVACITPSLSYTSIVVDPRSLNNAVITQDPQDVYTAYRGECSRLIEEESKIRKESPGFSGSIVSNDYPNGKDAVCTPAQLPASVPGRICTAEDGLFSDCTIVSCREARAVCDQK